MHPCIHKLSHHTSRADIVMLDALCNAAVAARVNHRRQVAVHRVLHRVQVPVVHLSTAQLNCYGVPFRLVQQLDRHAGACGGRRHLQHWIEIEFRDEESNKEFAKMRAIEGPSEDVTFGSR